MTGSVMTSKCVSCDCCLPAFVSVTTKHRHTHQPDLTGNLYLFIQRQMLLDFLSDRFKWKWTQPTNYCALFIYESCIKCYFNALMCQMVECWVSFPGCSTLWLLPHGQMQTLWLGGWLNLSTGAAPVCFFWLKDSGANSSSRAGQITVRISYVNAESLQ